MRNGVQVKYWCCEGMRGTRAVIVRSSTSHKRNYNERRAFKVSLITSKIPCQWFILQPDGLFNCST